MERRNRDRDQNKQQNTPKPRSKNWEKADRGRGRIMGSNCKNPGVWRLIPIVSTWEAERRGSEFHCQSGVHEILSQKTKGQTSRQAHKTKPGAGGMAHGEEDLLLLQRTGFVSQHSHWRSQPLATPAPGIWYPLLASMSTRHTCSVLPCRQDTYTYKIKIKRSGIQTTPPLPTKPPSYKELTGYLQILILSKPTSVLVTFLLLWQNTNTWSKPFRHLIPEGEESITSGKPRAHIFKHKQEAENELIGRGWGEALTSQSPSDVLPPTRLHPLILPK